MSSSEEKWRKVVNRDGTINIVTEPDDEGWSFKVCLINKGSRDRADLLVTAPKTLAALKRLENAAFSRDVTMGDPSRLIEVKAELDAAAKHAREIIAEAEGRS